MVRANGIELCFDVFGADDAEPMVMIMGLGAQLIHWDDDFCKALAACGFRVIRFDNRDIGHSTKLSGSKRITIKELLKLRFFGTPLDAPYTLRDMADDTIGLLDALDIEAAHVVGASMGGMIAQEIAISHPRRLRSLTSIMSSTGDPKLPQPTREASMLLLARHPATKDAYLKLFARTWKILRNGSFPAEEALDRDRAERTFARGLNPAGVGRQLRAILASGDRTERLLSVRAPTLVIHGSNDPVVRPEAGRATAAAVPGANLLMLEGMGHAIPMPMWPQIVNAIVSHARAASPLKVAVPTRTTATERRQRHPLAQTSST
ncbi:alpha/beta fold hydrolase [Rhodopseudomonas sp. P2A-2r]|uniref:alpha/beta fold hydrolase n=1 Tax=unclassified Rhodopseudomonas TaxID=2638247 RepID=UPI0039B7002D